MKIKRKRVTESLQGHRRMGSWVQRVLNKGFEGEALPTGGQWPVGAGTERGGGWESGAGSAGETDGESKPAQPSVRSTVMGSSPGQ